jgi:hypothetical protein
MYKIIIMGVCHEHVVYTDLRGWNRRTSSSSLTKPQSRQKVHVGCTALIAAEHPHVTKHVARGTEQPLHAQPDE